MGAAIILTVSMIGSALGADTYIFDFEQAIGYVDFEVIFLVLGMMIIVGTIERTGIFQWTAYQAYRILTGTDLVTGCDFDAADLGSICTCSIM